MRNLVFLMVLYDFNRFLTEIKRIYAHITFEWSKFKHAW